MAKIISRKKQNDVYQRLVRIISTLSKDGQPSYEIKDAIEDAFDIALIVGDIDMLEALGDDPPVEFSNKRRWKAGDKLSNFVELIDDCMWK